MKKQIKYLYKINPIFIYLRKHYCPKCNMRLKVKYTSEIINSYSNESNNYNFSTPENKLKGDVEFREGFFFCETCRSEFSFLEMKHIEKKRKDTNSFEHINKNTCNS
jgi:hypothetical protein